MDKIREHAGIIGIGFTKQSDYEKLKSIIPEVDMYAANMSPAYPDGRTVYLADLKDNESDVSVPFVARVVFDGVDEGVARRALLNKCSQYGINVRLSKNTREITEDMFAGVVKKFGNSSAEDNGPEPPVRERQYAPQKQEPFEDLDTMLKRMSEPEVTLNENLLPPDNDYKEQDYDVLEL